MAAWNNPAQIDHAPFSHGQLNCPCGKEGNLHQGNVTIFQRREDGNTTTVIAQEGRTAQVSDFPSQDTCNPSPRRHGLLIEFECEQCSYDCDGNTTRPPFRLAIFQHKGHTYMQWEE